MSLFSRFFSRPSKRRQQGRSSLSPDDIRRKLKDYQKTDGPADFGSAQLYRVEEEASEGSEKEEKQESQ